MNDNDPMRVIYGGGEIIGFLERMLTMARAGEIEVIAVATSQSDGFTGTGLAYRRDTDAPWSRTIGAVAVLQHHLISGELSFGE